MSMGQKKIVYPNGSDFSHNLDQKFSECEKFEFEKNGREGNQLRRNQSTEEGMLIRKKQNFFASNVSDIPYTNLTTSLNNEKNSHWRKMRFPWTLEFRRE
jgi:hypothetical protein